MFLIDFDDTLFDGQAFKEARLKAVARHGVSPDLYWDTYNERARSGYKINYSNVWHGSTLAKHGFDEAKITAALDETTTADRLPQWLFSDAVSFLQDLRQYNQPIVLLTHGDPSFQELKVIRSGVADWVDEVVLASGSKLPEVERRQRMHDTVWFINDKIGETEEVVKKVPGVRAILKVARKFPLADYATSQLPYFHTLTDIAKYVAEQF